MPELGEPLTLAQWPEGTDPFLPPIHGPDVDDVASATGLVCRVIDDRGTFHVAVGLRGWPDGKYASIDSALWKWLDTLERRAAFCRFAVLVPTERRPRTRVWTGIILWD